MAIKTCGDQKCGDQKVATKNMEIESWPSKTMVIEMCEDPNLWSSNFCDD